MYFQYLTQNMSKTISFTNTEGVYISYGYSKKRCQEVDCRAICFLILITHLVPIQKYIYRTVGVLSGQSISTLADVYNMIYFQIVPRDKNAIFFEKRKDAINNLETTETLNPLRENFCDYKILFHTLIFCVLITRLLTNNKMLIRLT